MKNGKDAVSDLQNVVAGMAGAGATVVGWAPGEAALLALKAQESATGRVAQGYQAGVAMEVAIGEAEMVLIMDVFSKALAAGDTPEAAFEKVVAIKMGATQGVPGAAEAAKAAREAYADALKGGIAPHAAVLSAFISAAATIRLAVGAPQVH